MASTETVKLHLPYEVMLGDGRSLTMLLLNPYVWYRTLRMAAIGSMQYRRNRDGFRPDEFESIEVSIDGNK